MKALTFVFFCLVGLPARADLSSHALFKHFIGNWKAVGELKGENSNLVTITEQWTGKADGENGFLIEGTRTMNRDTQAFKWAITHNTATDMFDAILTGADGSQTLRFEGNVSMVNLTLELKAITGSGSSSITVLDSLLGDTKEVIESKVTFTGEVGQTTLEGIIKHEKQKTP